MRTRSYSQLLLSVLLIMLLFSSCFEEFCDNTQSYVRLDPIYVESSQYRIDPEFKTDRRLSNPGKFYFYNQLILINELREGIHILDNSDPSQPEHLGFIKIPGNLDMAVKENVLYADNYSDLLAIDINNLQQPQLLCRVEGSFSDQFIPEEGRFLSHYQATPVTEEVDCQNPNFGELLFSEGGSVFFESEALASGSSLDFNGVPVNTNTNNTQTEGIGGSMARFTLADNHLYVINDKELVAFDVQQASKPTETQTTSVAEGIETVFPHGEHLFIGASDGMYIYSLANPQKPQYVSAFRHAQACDPVFVQGEVAFVTLRDGTNCQNFINQLDVVDISDIRNPRLIKTYPMEHPHGLSVCDNQLYLCEGVHGLKVFDVRDLEEIDERQLDHVKGMNAFDAISLNTEHLLVIGQDGLYQYNTKEPSMLEQISFFQVD